MLVNTEIARLIEDNMRRLGMTRAELARRTGTKNITKRLRRIDELMTGNLRLATELKSPLVAALEVDEDVWDAAIAMTREQSEEATRWAVEKEEAAYRAHFKPHAIILAERSVPSPIFVAAAFGVERLMWIEFEKGSNPVTYSDQARRRLPSAVLAFGKPTGYVVNYSPDRAVEFDLNGTPIAAFDSAVRLGNAHTSFGKKWVSDLSFMVKLGFL